MKNLSLLILVVAFSFVACGQSNTDSQPANQQPQKQKQLTEAQKKQIQAQQKKIADFLKTREQFSKKSRLSQSKQAQKLYRASIQFLQDRKAKKDTSEKTIETIVTAIVVPILETNLEKIRIEKTNKPIDISLQIDMALWKYAMEIPDSVILGKQLSIKAFTLKEALLKQNRYSTLKETKKRQKISEPQKKYFETIIKQRASLPGDLLIQNLQQKLKIEKVHFSIIKAGKVSEQALSKVTDILTESLLKQYQNVFDVTQAKKQRMYKIHITQVIANFAKMIGVLILEMKSHEAELKQQLTEKLQKGVSKKYKKLKPYLIFN